jgi:recombination protein RecT
MSTAIEKATSQKPATLKDWFQSDYFKGQVQLALPKHCTPERFIRAACTSLMRVPKLANCTQESVFQCMLQLSQLGIEPDGRRAHLIPFEDRKSGKTICTLIVDYKGLAELVMNTGLVSYIHADVVCDNDEFEYNKGELKTHKIDFKKDRGTAYAAYALCRFKDGSEKCEVIPRSQIETIRDRSNGYKAFKNGYTKTNPWDTDEQEMWKKTAFRRLSKWLPLSSEQRDTIDSDQDRSEINVTPVAPQFNNPFAQVQAPVVQQIEAPTIVDIEPTPENPDETAEAAAGLAPEPKTETAPQPEQPAKPVELASPANDLSTMEERLKSAGITEAEFTGWCLKNRHITEPMNLEAMAKRVPTKLRNMIAKFDSIATAIKGVQQPKV